MYVGIRDKIGVMQKNRRVVRVGIHAKVTNQFYREVSHIAMHQIQHPDNNSERSDALESLKNSNRTQSTPSCNGMRSFDYAYQI